MMELMLKMFFFHKEYNFNKIRNFYFFVRIIWQSNVIKECFFAPFNQVIFLGDMNILSTWICISKFFRKRQFGKHFLPINN